MFIYAYMANVYYRILKEQLKRGHDSVHLSSPPFFFYCACMDQKTSGAAEELSLDFKLWMSKQKLPDILAYFLHISRLCTEVL